MPDYDQMVRRQKVLAEFGEFTLSCDDLDEILTEACRLVAEALGTDRAKVLEIQEEGQQLFVRAGVGWASGVVGQLHLPMGEHSSETYSIQEGRPVVTQDIGQEDRFEIPGFMREAGVVALVNVPIRLPGNKAYGLLQVDDTKVRDFGEEDAEFLRTYSSILGPVIDRLLKLRALHASDERFRLTVEAARDYAVFVTDPQNRITDWLPGAQTVFGWTGEEAVGQPVAITFTPEDRESGQDRWETETARKEGMAPNVRWHIRKDGRRVFIEGSTRALRDPNGVLLGFLKIGQDVTERRAAEAALQENEKRQAFLLSLSDALGLLATPAEIATVATTRLCEHLGITRVYYGQIKGDLLTVEQDHTRSVPSMVGEHSLRPFGPHFIAIYRPGAVIMVEDVGHDPRLTPAARAQLRDGQIAASADAVLFEEEGEVSVLAVQSATPRAWSAPEEGLIREVGERVKSAIKRARAEAALREGEERQRFLLALGDAMRAEPSAEGKIEIAARHLGERLKASRVLWGEYDWQNGLAHIFNGWLADGAQPFPTVMRLKDYEGEVLNDLRAGRTVRVDDVGLQVEKPAYAAIVAVGVQALLSVPLIVGGRLAVNVSIHQHDPRRWSDAEVLLVQDVAERLWAEVVRARAETALRESEERFRAFAENSADTIWIASGDGRRLEYLSPAFERMFGEDRAGITADLRRWAELLHPEDREAAMRAMPRALAGEMVIVHYRVVRPSDGRLVHLRDTGFPIRDEAGAVVRVAGIVQDVTDIATAREALEAEKERFRTLTEGIPQLVWRSCDEGRWTWASPQWRDYTGQSGERSHGLGWLDAVHPEDRERTMAAWHAARSHGGLDVEYRVQRAADGAWRWHQTRSVPVRNGATAEQPEGRIVEWLGTTTDIDDLKRLQAEQAVLVAELQHRTRNLLAVVRNLARRSIPPQPGGDEYDERLAALGRVQGFLARTERYAVALRDLVEAELAAAGDGVSDRVTVEGPPVDLPGEGTQPVALALHELATNAVKYGAIAQPGGRLSVTWQIEEGVDGARLLIAWRETGVAMPGGPPARRGYGSELITRALPYQMRAETALEFTPDGVRCSIALPAGAFRGVEEVGS